MAADANADAKLNELRGTLPAGTRLRNYELISVLGHGGFGITYYARDTTLGREVAVKEYLPTALALREEGSMVVPRSTQHGEDFIWGRERFLAEARILATLENAPSVVRVYDYLEANGTAYMVMALARGETLEQRLKRHGQLSPSIVERLLGGLLDGLDAVHRAGFLHRDVKPANIILDARNNPTLIDFGASRASMADRTSALTAIFTPRYAAAEQLMSDKQGPWTDIYGLSATLHHAITGHPPPSSVERALNDTYEPLVRLSPAGFSFGTLHGIDVGLAVRASDRPQSIARWREVLAAADEAGSDATMLATRMVRRATVEPPSTTAGAPEPGRPAGKGRRLALYAGLAVAGLILAAGSYWMLATKPAAGPASPQTAAIDSGEAAAKAQAEQQRADEQAAARQRAEAEARQKADAEARQKAETEVRQKAAAEAQQKAEVEARQRAEAEAQQKAAVEAQQKAAAEAQQKADAEAAAQRSAEADEAALRLAPLDRQRIQVALTSLGFDTHGIDGVFGQRSREMILGWQRARNQPATGFLTAAQQQALIAEAAPALAKYDADLKKADEARRREEAAAKAAASAPAAPSYVPSLTNGVSCQDSSGRRIDFPNVTSCPYGLRPVR
jgi:serine/threonine protein kinase